MHILEKEILHPNQPGQIVKFHTPYPDEDPNQLYLLLEIFEYDDDMKSAATIKALIKGWSFLPVNKVFLEDLEVAEVDTTHLIGYRATIIKNDGQRISGIITATKKEKQVVSLSKQENQVKTNVQVSINDALGKSHQGTLAVIF